MQLARFCARQGFRTPWTALTTRRLSSHPLSKSVPPAGRGSRQRQDRSLMHMQQPCPTSPASSLNFRVCHKPRAARCALPVHVNGLVVARALRSLSSGQRRVCSPSGLAAGSSSHHRVPRAGSSRALRTRREPSRLWTRSSAPWVRLGHNQSTMPKSGLSSTPSRSTPAWTRPPQSTPPLCCTTTLAPPRPQPRLLSGLQRTSAR